ncbi:Vacuolar protein sorting-associated protein 24-1-like protein [Morus notabilis]|uniref:Vacuolar protein sorting-associated protein 24-1-like protein n=1 Tax=Morus notabilis TaxID=981085 RepID=W9SH57_9ROSA|nr:Vacuolar protein sorting-associated protein 24-1-like protein [Morus notabilis]
MLSWQALAKELVRSKKTVNRLHENKAQMNSISMHLGESDAIACTVGHLSKSSEVMKLVNNLMKAPEVAATMQEFSKEMTKRRLTRFLTAIAGETSAQLPEAVRKEKMKQPAVASQASCEDELIAEGVDDEHDLEEIRARLAKVMQASDEALVFNILTTLVMGSHG